MQYIASCKLPTPWAVFDLHAFSNADNGEEHVMLTLGQLAGEPLLIRVHSECLTGDCLFSQRCDCGAQLKAAMQAIAAEGRGALLYLRQEGRGIGLINKIRAYQLQDQGADTVQANEQLGFSADLRHYDVCKPMLAHFGISRVRLMTNNPKKVAALQDLGIEVVERIPIEVNRNPHNMRYLATKAAKLGHLLHTDTNEVSAETSD